MRTHLCGRLVVPSCAVLATDHTCTAFMPSLLLLLQDYIDSMEGATLSGRQCAYAMLSKASQLAGSTAAAAKQQEKQPVAA